MRTVAWLLLAACGGQPLLANAPAPPAGAVAGAAAAAAAAMTLADPDAATRKPEKKQQSETRGVEVKENVPPDVFDRLDHPPPGGGSDANDTSDTSGANAAKPVKARARKGPPPKLPSPRDISDPNDHQ